MNVYILYYDNGESYENSYTNVDSVYATSEAACKAMREKGFTIPVISRTISQYWNARRKPKLVCPYEMEFFDEDQDKCGRCFIDCPYIYEDESYMYYVEMEVKE